MKYKVCIIGHFGFRKQMFDGQTVKTKIIADELENNFGKNKVLKVDTAGGVKRALDILVSCIRFFQESDNIIMLPAHNGLLILTPMLYFFNLIFRKRLHYIVIGGWLPDYLKQHQLVKRLLKKFYRIYVETPIMKKNLLGQRFSNIEILYNCKRLKIMDERSINHEYKEPYKLCTFSRVMKEKGIEDAIDSVIKVNENMRRVVCCLDIYGQIDEEYRERFEMLKDKFPKYIKYKGVVDFNTTTETLKEYYALLFPTHFKTEGIPGTIIDALAAGIPTVAHSWDSADLMVEQKETGIIYPCEEASDLQEAILWILGCNKDIIKYKKAALEKANSFIPENALNGLINNLK